MIDVVSPYIKPFPVFFQLKTDWNNQTLKIFPATHICHPRIATTHPSFAASLFLGSAPVLRPTKRKRIEGLQGKVPEACRIVEQKSNQQILGKPSAMRIAIEQKQKQRQQNSSLVWVSMCWFSPWDSVFPCGSPLLTIDPEWFHLVLNPHVTCWSVQAYHMFSVEYWSCHLHLRQLLFLKSQSLPDSKDSHRLLGASHDVALIVALLLLPEFGPASIKRGERKQDLSNLQNRNKGILRDDSG